MRPRHNRHCRQRNRHAVGHATHAGDGLARQRRQLGRNLWRLVQPWLGRLVGLPLAPLPRETIASVGGMPYGVAIALATVAVVAWPHR